MAAPADLSALIRRFAAIPDRGACTDGERLAALHAVRELRALGRRGARIQPLWVRPAGALVAAVLAVAGVAADVVSVGHPRTGLGIAVAALLLLAADLSGRAPVLRRLTVGRATQNVVCPGGREDAPVRLLVTAALDTPRGGLLDGSGPLPRAVTRLRRRLGGHLPGRYGVLAAALAASAACSAARAGGTDARWLGALQLVPSIALLAAVGLFVDAATARAGRSGAGANASACAVALALVAALDRRPPRALAVDLVLAGAGEAGALGARRWWAEQRRAGVGAADVAVLHIAACGSGRPVWWTRDGLVVAASYHPQLVRLAGQVAADEAHLGARPHESRRTSGARAARALRWPAIAIGCLDADGLVPRRGHDDDTVAASDPAAPAATLDFALALVAALDGELARARP